MADVIRSVSEPAIERGAASITGSFTLANADAVSFLPRNHDIIIDHSHATLGNFLPMRDESQRNGVCGGFDNVWHGNATVAQAAKALGLQPTGRMAHVSVEERHCAASTIARRVLAGEQLRGVCHCVPRRCHGHTIVRHVMAIVEAARNGLAAMQPTRRTQPRLSALTLLTLGLAVATPAAAAPPVTPHATPSPGRNAAGGVHPLLLPFMFGAPPAATARPPAPWLIQRLPPSARHGRPLSPVLGLAIAAGAATAVLAATRKRSAATALSPEMKAAPHARPAQRLRTRPPTVSPTRLDTSSGAPPWLHRATLRTVSPTVPQARRPLVAKAATRRRLSLAAGAEEGALRDEPPRQSEGPTCERWSPQPASATAARAAAALDLASTLANDTSKYAILQGRPDALAAVCEEARSLRDEGAKRCTSKRDAWGYGRVRLVCESAELCSPIMRPRTGTITDEGRSRKSFWAALLVRSSSW